MDDNGTVPDSDICTKPEHDTYVASIPIQYQSVEPITRNLKAASNIYELNTDLILMINQINANIFTTEDITPAIKKIAETRKAILDMIINI